MESVQIKRSHVSQKVFASGLGAIFLIFVSLFVISFFLCMSEGSIQFLVRIIIFFLTSAGLFLLFFLSLLYRRMMSQLHDNVEKISDRIKDRGARTKSLDLAIRKMLSILETQQVGVTTAIMMLEEISTLLSEVAKSAEETLLHSIEMQSQARSGIANVQGLQNAMTQIEYSYTQIEGLQDLISLVEKNNLMINDIVFKTQILSFNASIEAARAGPAGRGFSVIASEVGLLAKNSGIAAKKISGLMVQTRMQAADTVKNVKLRILSGKVASNECSDIIISIHSIIEEISPMIEAIKSMAEIQEKSMMSTKSSFEEIRSINNSALKAHRNIEVELDVLIKSDHDSFYILDRLQKIKEYTSVFPHSK